MSQPVPISATLLIIAVTVGAIGRALLILICGLGFYFYNQKKYLISVKPMDEVLSKEHPARQQRKATVETSVPLQRSSPYLISFNIDGDLDSFVTISIQKVGL